jgi:hypothetical protein
MANAYVPYGHPVDLVFNSANSSNGDRDAPQFYIDPPLVNVTGMQLLWSNIPYTWYNIDRTNNEIVFRTLVMTGISSSYASVNRKTRGGFELVPPSTSTTFTGQAAQNTVFTTYRSSNSQTPYNTAPACPNPREVQGSEKYQFYAEDSGQYANGYQDGWNVEQEVVVRIQPGSYNPDTLSTAIRNALAQTSLKYARSYQVFMDGSARLVIYNNGMTRDKLWYTYNSSDASAISVAYTENGVNKTRSENDEEFQTRLTTLRNTQNKFSFIIPSESLANILGYEKDVEYMSSRIPFDRDSSRTIQPTYSEPTAFLKNTNGGKALDTLEVNLWANYQSLPEVVALAPRLVNLNQSTSIQLYSSLSGESDKIRDVTGYSGVVATIPITSIFTSIMQFFQQGQPIAFGSDKRVFNNIKFWFKLAGRSVYAKNSAHSYQSSDIQTVNYIPFNGQAFQICMRFWVDDGAMTTE